jgi:Ca-activated chloride channel family protein
MRRLLAVVTLALICAGSANANGIIIPEEKKVPPLAMLSHQVKVTIDDQVAVTTVEQIFRNHTDRQLEATYVFPVPKGASVRHFSMWLDGKEVPGELVDAAKARKIYTDIVQRTQDPGLLEYIGNDLLRIKVFPIPAHGDQKIKISYTSLAVADHELIEYIYPLKTNGKATKTLEKFSLDIHVKSQHTVQNIYSPTHYIAMTRPSDREAIIHFQQDQALLDKDFQLFYTAGSSDVGLTALTHRPNSEDPGYFMILASPRAELSKDQQIPRDMVFVLDTSGSMQGKRMEQARAALKFCLKQLGPKDRFALINFATVVNKYNDSLLPGTSEQLTAAGKWVDKLKAVGGTAIDDALSKALQFRTDDPARNFTIVFFTDGTPTVGELNPDKILANFAKKNSANTRLFTFGVGDDVNATLLDQLAEQSRAISTYVREAEDIEAKVSGLYSKISNPVLANLKLSVGEGVQISEVYPPHLPDLFHGSQLVILGRYTGKGHAAIKLTGYVGMDVKEFVYEVKFPEKTMQDDKTFVEDLWARRKVGYLLDQIRINGEKKELVDEVTALAKRYGITTPYTSFLIVPDAVLPVAGADKLKKAKSGKPNVSFDLLENSPVPPGLQGYGGPAGQMPVSKFITQQQATPGQAYMNRGVYMYNELSKIPGGYGGGYGGMGGYSADPYLRALQQAKDSHGSNSTAGLALKKGDKGTVQEGKLAVDLSCEYGNLRCQTKLSQSPVQRMGTSNCVEVGGVWIDEAFDAKMPIVTVKAMSKAYFRMLELQPKVRDVLRLGNHLVWVTPSGTALVIDSGGGLEDMRDAAIERMFLTKK